MGGMGGGVSTNDPTIVHAFYRALVTQGLIVAGLLIIVLIAWNVLRGLQLRRAAAEANGADRAPAVHGLLAAEPAARRVLRVGFGLLWLFDGLLQGQASMPNGLVPQVIQPAASSSPGWVRHLVSTGTQVWSYHPVTVAAGTVWLQAGIGIWLLVAPRGNWSRLGGVASAGWGLLVWVFGEAFGAIFAPGLTLLFGAPGAVFIYVVAGVLLALPESIWARPATGRWILRGTGLFLLGLGVLQAWPGRGFWQGQTRADGPTGSLTTMLQQMAQTPQPHVFKSIVSSFADFDAAHGWAVNLVVSVALIAIGIGFLGHRLIPLRVTFAATVVFGLAVWVLIQDLGFMGGVGTDPNSMVPFLLLVGAGYVAITRVPLAAEAMALSSDPAMPRPSLARLTAEPAYALRIVAAASAIVVTIIGAAPMAYAATRPNADGIITQEIDGPADAVNQATPEVQLVDQTGAPVDLHGLAGKAVALTFLDPVCTSDCPIIANEFLQADRMLGLDAKKVVMVAIDANPTYLNRAYLQAFDRQEHLDRLPNWLYLTGSLPHLIGAWRDFGVEVTDESGGGMVDHSDIAYVIDPAGRTRFVLDADPGPGTKASESSFAVTLDKSIRSVLKNP